MPDLPISGLPDGGDPQNTDDFVVARGATNNKIAWSSMSNALATQQVVIAASNTTYTSGTVELTGVGGGVTVGSNAGQQVEISVAAPVAQSVQTQNVVDVTLSGNTSGVLALVSSGTMTLAGGNNITLSQVGNAITISGASIPAESQSFIGGISASDTLYTSGSVRFTGSQAATVRSGTGQLVIIDVPAQTTQVETQTFIAGISASDTLYTSGNVRFTGVGGGVTVSSNTGQRVDISVAAQSVQPETQTFIGGISASNTLYTSGSVRFTGSQAVTVRSGTGQLVVIDVPAQTTQVETQTFLGAIGNSQTTYTSGTVNLSVNGGLLTIRSTTGQAFQFSVSQSVQLETQTAISGIANSQTTYTSGTVSLSELGAITIRSTTGNQFQFSVNAQTAQTGISGIANSQTTYTSGTVSLSELGAITIRSTTGNQYQFSVNSQTAQTQSNIQALYDGANSVTTGTVRLTDANGVTFSINAQTLSASVNQSISMFAVSNTTQSTSGTAHKSALSFGGAGGVSVGVTGGSVVISGGAGGAGMSAGLSNIGNTAGDTATVTGRLVLAGGNNITLSGSTNGGSMTITVSAPNLGGGAFSAGVSTGGNTAGATGVTGTQLVLVGSGPISLSQTTGAAGGTVSINAPATSSLSATGQVSISTNGSTISIGAPIISGVGLVTAATNAGTVSIGVPHITAANWENMPAMEPVLYTLLGGVTKTPFYWIENIPQGIQPKNIAMRVSLVTANSDLSMSIHFGIYTFVNSTSANLLGSGSDAFVVSSASSVSFSAQRNLVLTSPGTVAAISSLTPGNYLFGAMFSATNTNAINASIYAASAAAGPRLGRIMPGTNQLSTATSQGIAGLYGRGSTTVNALPANVVASEVVNQGIGASSPMKPYIFIRS